MKTTIIAEIGINHAGDVKKAKAMVVAAKAAGADIAKFQHYNPEKILGKNSPYLKEASECQLTRFDHQDIANFCRTIGIEWGMSVFHAEDLLWMEQSEIKRYKISSRSMLDRDLLREVNKIGKPIIMSTGMSESISDVGKAVALLADCDVTLLYCVCRYPARVGDCNFKFMQELKSLASNVGFSSHCPNIVPTLFAVANGATTVENHVTMSKTQRGCDISSSLDFTEFSLMVDQIRTMERLLPGEVGEKCLTS